MWRECCKGQAEITHFWMMRIRRLPSYKMVQEGLFDSSRREAATFESGQHALIGRGFIHQGIFAFSVDEDNSNSCFLEAADQSRNSSRLTTTCCAQNAEMP